MLTCRGRSSTYCAACTCNHLSAAQQVARLEEAEHTQANFRVSTPPLLVSSQAFDDPALTSTYNTVKGAGSGCRKWDYNLDILLIVHFKVGAPGGASWGTGRGCTNPDRCASALAKHAGLCSFGCPDANAPGGGLLSWGLGNRFWDSQALD